MGASVGKIGGDEAPLIDQRYLEGFFGGLTAESPGVRAGTGVAVPTDLLERGEEVRDEDIVVIMEGAGKDVARVVNLGVPYVSSGSGVESVRYVMGGEGERALNLL